MSMQGRLPEPDATSQYKLQAQQILREVCQVEYYAGSFQQSGARRTRASQPRAKASGITWDRT